MALMLGRAGSDQGPAHRGVDDVEAVDGAGEVMNLTLDTGTVIAVPAVVVSGILLDF